MSTLSLLLDVSNARVAKIKAYLKMMSHIWTLPLCLPHSMTDEHSLYRHCHKYQHTYYLKLCVQKRTVEQWGLNLYCYFNLLIPPFYSFAGFLSAEHCYPMSYTNAVVMSCKIWPYSMYNMHQHANDSLLCRVKTLATVVNSRNTQSETFFFPCENLFVVFFLVNCTTKATLKRKKKLLNVITSHLTSPPLQVCCPTWAWQEAREAGPR